MLGGPSQVELEKAAVEKIKEMPDAVEKVKTLAIRQHLEAKKKLDEELDKKIKALTQEYELQFKPIYKTIADIAVGKKSVETEDLWKADEVLNEDEKKGLEEARKSTSPIKNYWADALANHSMLASFINENDEKALAHVVDIEYFEDEKTEDVEITIHFSENEFFSNEKLSSRIKNDENGEPKEVVATAVEWKEGKNLTKKITTKEQKQKNKKTKQTRTITKEEDCESFFNIFKSAVLNEEEEETIDAVNTASDVVHAIVDEVVPYSVEYFLGIREDDYGACEEDFDEEEMDEEDNEEDEDAGKKKKSKKAPRKGSGKEAAPSAGGAGDQKPECKQQ